uniref:dipeptidyl peptidase 4-like n=1 Tax=Styela clava TaxID=7725 RepID=UPI001939C156|nr:dipeptidyl peptidase 4-like [Styela clava]
MKKNISNDDESELLSSSAWKSLRNPSLFYASADLQYVAITYQHKDSYVEYLRTFSVSMFRTNDSQQVFSPGFPEEGILKIKWDSVGHKMAYVYDFNVFLLLNFSSSPIQITEDGKNNIIANGISDITNDDALMWWSPNGTYLAYVKSNQTGVERFEFPYYGGSQYPTMVSYPYPKPGKLISKTLIFIINVENPTESFEVIPSDSVTGWGEYYLNSVVWKNDQIFMPTWKNRLQNEAISESCISISNLWTCNHVSEDVIIGHNSWLGEFEPSDLYPIPNTNEYLTVRENSLGYLHLVLVNRTKNSLDWRTNGTFEVVHRSPAGEALHFYDKRNDYAYFTSTEVEGTEDGLPRIRHLWKVKAHGDRTRECVSCDLNTIYADRCNWVDPTFSPEGSYVVINCGGTGNGVPVSTLHHISDFGEVSLQRVVENNTQIIENLEAYKFRTREYGELSLPQVDDEVFYYTLHIPQLQFKQKISIAGSCLFRPWLPRHNRFLHFDMADRLHTK